MNSISHLSPHALLPGRVLAIILVACLAALASSAAPATAQEPPPLLPSGPVSHIVTFQVEALAEAQYDEELTVLDFDPGSWTQDQRHSGMAFFSVVEGNVTLRQAGKETQYDRGQSFRNESGTLYAIGNQEAAKARLIMTTLTSPGLPATAVHPDAARPARQPVKTFSGKATFGNIPARFTLNQLITNFRAGAGSGAHIHPTAQGISIVMAGEGRHRLLSGDVVQKVGEVFVDGPPGRAVSHEQIGSQTMTVVASYVGWGAGGAPAVPASIPGVPPLPAPAVPGTAVAPDPAISPPRTGDGGLK